jgi:hypothetical protein
MKMFLPLALSGLLAAGCSPVAPPSSDVGRYTPLTFTAVQATNALNRVGAFVSACTPRDAGTPGAERAAQWLHDQLIENGVEATIDRFTDETPRGQKTFVNVLAELPGETDGWVVLLSHFDTKRGISPSFQGANDGGSSTGLLLEFAIALKRTPLRKYGVICAFLDGEECDLAYSDRDGFHGSKRYAQQLKAKGRKVKAVILSDMIGDRDLKITVPMNSTSTLRVLALDAAEATGERAKIGLFDGEIFDDHQAFLDRGLPAIDLIDFDYGSSPGLNDYWHTAKDTVDKLSADSLLATGRIVFEMINRL